MNNRNSLHLLFQQKFDNTRKGIGEIFTRINVIFFF